MKLDPYGEAKWIKRWYWEGISIAQIARDFRLPYARVSNVIGGRAAYYVPWPDGSIGMASALTQARVDKAHGYTGVSTVQREEMEILLQADALQEEGER